VHIRETHCCQSELKIAPFPPPPPQGGDSIDLNKLRPDDVLVEAVVASRSPMVDKTIRDLQFRTRYNAIIIAVHRHGTRINR
jgi:Trk K+ transport system NAD-binding subunit